MTSQEEIWKDVPGYEGLYQVSNIGNVRSLDRVTQSADGKYYFRKGRILKLNKGTHGYLTCNLSANGIYKPHPVHQLVAMAFLNHMPNGYNLVIDHINNVKADNRPENLQLVTNRYNSTKTSRGTSKYPGVCWRSQNKKWVSKIKINGKDKHLGYFTDEAEAGLAYQKALKEQVE